LQTIGQESKTLICISFTKLNIHLLLERVFLNFPGYSLTVTQMQANATERLHKFRNRSHISRDAKRVYEKNILLACLITSTHRYTSSHPLVTTYKKVVTIAAEVSGSGFHTPSPSYCWTSPDFSTLQVVARKEFFKEFGDWHTEHVPKSAQPMECYQFIYLERVIEGHSELFAGYKNLFGFCPWNEDKTPLSCERLKPNNLR
ncbi:hypothetical protein CSKR_111086, partial [Clonorchis sinensis]